MNNTGFIRVNTLSDLIGIKKLYKEKAYILAGGTDVMIRIKKGILNPVNLIYCGGISELKGIYKIKGTMIIGSMTTFSDLCVNTMMKNYFPLYTASKKMASAQIRNIATIGGNIVNASPSADSVPPLFLMKVDLKIISDKSERYVPINKFFKGPGKTILKNDEILHSVHLHENSFTKNNSGFIKVGLREALAIAVLSVAWHKKDGTVSFAFGGVAPTVVYCEIAENEKKAKIKKIIDDLICPISDIRSTSSYRTEVIHNIVCKVLNDRNNSMGRTL